MRQLRLSKRLTNRWLAFCSVGLIAAGVLDGAAQWWRQQADARAAVRVASRQERAAQRQGLGVEPSVNDAEGRGDPRVEQRIRLARAFARAHGEFDPETGR